MRTLALSVLLALALSAPARANDDPDTTRFMCHTESAANAIAEQVAKGDDNADDDIARPYVESGECIVLPVEVEVDINYRGKIFSGKLPFKVQVVGFPVLGSTNPTWYGIMPVVPADAVHGTNDA